MTDTKSVHTLNARGNIFLEIMRDHFKLSSEQMFREIQALRDSVERALSLKGINYDALKTALVPDRKRKEIALVFDSLVIDDGWYGLEVARRIIPLFDKDSNHAVLVGDYIDTGAGQKLLEEALSQAVTLIRPVDYRHSSQFYIVYINNLTDAMIARFHNGLYDWGPYIGFADTTYTSPFKTLLSTMLVNSFVKHRRIIIQGHEDDRLNSEDVNTSGFPFEQNGYVCRSVQSLLEGTFLSYKIERPVFPGFEVDTEFSLNAISNKPLPLLDFTIEVEQAKLAYLKSAKSGSVTRAGVAEFTNDQLASLLRSKISSSYIYNMSYNENHNVAKFNVIVELTNQPETSHMRLLAAMEYKAESKTLRLITLY
ncbi:MAG: hypothetical protein U1E15_05645 [Hyphomicrobiales bacterium]